MPMPRPHPRQPRPHPPLPVPQEGVQHQHQAQHQPPQIVIASYYDDAEHREHAAAAGADTQMIAGADLAKLPMYDPDPGTMTEAGKNLVEALRKADGGIVSSPCYHGGVSGLIKNAIDYIEEMRADARVYLDGRSIGIIACGYGYQGPGPVLNQLRQTAHAFGFAEYDAPVLEPLELYKTKSGDEIEAQLFSFTDKGGREVALRPEMTMTGMVIRASVMPPISGAERK